MPLVVSRSEGNNILQLKKQRVSNGIQDFRRLSLCSFHYSMLHLQLSKIKICNWFWILCEILLKIYLHIETVSFTCWQLKSQLGKIQNIYRNDLSRAQVYHLSTWANKHFLDTYIHTQTQRHSYTCHYWLLLLHVNESQIPNLSASTYYTFNPSKEPYILFHFINPAYFTSLRRFKSLSVTILKFPCPILHILYI